MPLFDEAIGEVAEQWAGAIGEFMKENFDMEPDPAMIRTEFERMIREVNPELAAFRKQDFITQYGEDELLKQETLALRRVEG
jgi:hypothetical protein